MQLNWPVKKERRQYVMLRGGLRTYENLFIAGIITLKELLASRDKALSDTVPFVPERHVQGIQ